MAEVIRLDKAENSTLKNLENIIELAKQGEFENYVFAAYTKDGDVATSWNDGEEMDLHKRQTLVTHLQMDIIMAVVAANLE